MSEPVALTSTPNTGTFDVVVTFALEAGEADNSGIVKYPVAPGVLIPVCVEVVVTPVAQDAPVTALYPTVDVQPVGKPVVVPVVPVVVVRPAFNAALVIGPTWLAGTNHFDV